ncbi:MAG: GNAT family N-acetyltransferase [Chloroflexota bacterium]|nr:GNAT family N-acetyltransferase [Chloroflexota bacterium]
MDVQIQEMAIGDYDEVYELWQSTDGISLGDVDTRESIARFLERNPGFSYVARQDGLLVGAVLTSHDGRRGYIDHLAVRESHRRQGIGRALVLRSLYHLMRVGIRRWNLFVFEGNQDAIEFWKKIGWTPKLNMIMMSQPITTQT